MGTNARRNDMTTVTRETAEVRLGWRPLVGVVGVVALFIAGFTAVSTPPTRVTATVAHSSAATALLAASILADEADTRDVFSIPATGPSARSSGSGMEMCTLTNGAVTTPMDMVEGPLEMQMYPTTCKAPTWSELSDVYHKLSIAQAATAKYRDVGAAQSAGYYTAPVLYVASQGYHYINPAYLRDLRLHGFNAATPPILVYNRVGGRMTLDGVMYYMPLRTTARQLAAIFPFSMASWHRHINICVASSGNSILPIHDSAACVSAHGQFIPSTGWMVHAWLYHSASSVFAMDE